MNIPQLAFGTSFVAVILLGTPLLYPGIRRHAKSGRASLLAALSATSLFATGIALAAAMLVKLATVWLS